MKGAKVKANRFVPSPRHFSNESSASAGWLKNSSHGPLAVLIESGLKEIRFVLRLIAKRHLVVLGVVVPFSSLRCHVVLLEGFLSARSEVKVGRRDQWCVKYWMFSDDHFDIEGLGDVVGRADLGWGSQRNQLAVT